MRFTLPAVLALVLFALPVSGRAQTAPFDAPPVYLAVIDGPATLERDGDAQSAVTGMPIVPGDRIRTARGRVELLFPDGTALDIDEFTVVELNAIDRLRLFEGRVIFGVVGAMNPASAASFHIDTSVAGIDTYGPGEYRVALVNGRFGIEAELAVSRGSAALTGDRGTETLRAGQLSTVSGGGLPAYPQTYNTARFDDFTRWAADRRDERLGSATAQYLPPDLRMYSSALDEDGQWQYESSYGYVWYPAVAASWHPYYDGYWSSVPAYGWTWVGGPRWAWPTHHYGRWGVSGARWFWIPDHHYASAWVSWSAAPGYVGWCPLGFDNRPVASISAHFEASRAAINAWVVMPRAHFGVRGEPVQRFATTRQALPPQTPFIAQIPSPAAAPVTSARRMASSLPSGSATAVPRGPSSFSAPRTPDSRSALERRAPAAPATVHAPAAAAALERRPSPPASRAYVPERTTQTGHSNGTTYIGTVPNVPPPSNAVSPAYAPRPVDPDTYGVQGRYSPGGPIPRYAPGGAVPGGAGGVTSGPRAESREGGFRRTAPAYRAAPPGDGGPRRNGQTSSPSAGPGGHPSRAETAPVGAPAAGTSGSTAAPASPAPAAGVPVQPRGHRAR